MMWWIVNGPGASATRVASTTVAVSALSVQRRRAGMGGGLIATR